MCFMIKQNRSGSGRGLPTLVRSNGLNCHFSACSKVITWMERVQEGCGKDEKENEENARMGEGWREGNKGGEGNKEGRREGEMKGGGERKRERERERERERDRESERERERERYSHSHP